MLIGFAKLITAASHIRGLKPEYMNEAMLLSEITKIENSINKIKSYLTHEGIADNKKKPRRSLKQEVAHHIDNGTWAKPDFLKTKNKQ